MRTVFQVISALALVATVGAPVAYLADAIELDTAKAILLLATLGWFVHAPLWIGRREEASGA